MVESVILVYEKNLVVKERRGRNSRWEVVGEVVEVS